MNEQMKNALIGIFVLLAIVISISLLVFLEPKAGDGETTLRVRFPSVEKISLGTRVSFAGKHVGEVVAIREIASSREEELDAYGHVYAYELLLQIDSSIKVYKTDDVALHTSGLLGEKSIAIIPNPPPKGKSLELVEDDILYAKAPGSFEETIKKFISLSLKAEKTLDEVIDLINTNNQELFFTIKSIRKTIESLDESIEHSKQVDLIGSITKAAQTFSRSMDKLGGQVDLAAKENLIEELASTMRHFKEVGAAVNKPRELSQLVENLHAFSIKMNDLEKKVAKSWELMDSSLGNFSVVADNMKEMTDKGKEATKNLQQITNDIRGGQGDLGKLIYRDDLYFTSRAIMNKVGTIMNDINHYGLLFHLDKGWQRQRTKRMNILAELSTPQQFRDYFEEEVDQISTSLSRVNLLLERVDDKKDDQEYAGKFQQGFSDLMRKVDTLRDHLKLYSQELIEQTP